MAVRIYALAKELKLDSKELVDLCPKAGISGKGSALASLDDDEVAKLKAFLSGGPDQEGSKPTPTPAAKVKAKPKPKAVAKPPALPAMNRPEDYIAPAGTTGRPRIIETKRPPRDSESKKKKSPESEESRVAARTGPAIKLAPMPMSPTPPQKPVDEGPAPQKPDIKLPADAIRASKAGAKPLSEHLRKHEKRRKATTGSETATRKGGRGPVPTAKPAPSPLSAVRERGRRGVVAKKGDESKSGTGELAGREGRQLRRKRRTGVRRGRDDDSSDRPRRRRIRRTGANTAAPRKGNATLVLPCTVRSFSEAVGLQARTVMGKLLTMGTPAIINAALDDEVAELLAVELGVEIDFKRAADLEDQLLLEPEQQEDPPELLQPRAPVVTFLGHVDHGKTSLLDKIIGIDVVSGESGGITQHIRAYRLEKNDRAIAFVDTPGHEAFTEMRARGANVTDIAVLVVAADDGVMPQTEEAISHARAADVPIVVALNKMDLPGIDLNKIMQQLSTNDLLPTEWGGDIEVVKCSAMTGEGVDDLVETLLTIAELHDLKANPTRPAYGTCLEAELNEGRGVMAKLLVQKGTLKDGDVMVCGSSYGRVKAMYDTLNPRVLHEEAGPSTPINLAGLNEAPAAGEHFYVLDSISDAREIAAKRSVVLRDAALSNGGTHVTLENLFDRLGDVQGVQTLNLILRADVRGSIEAIQKELQKLDHPEVKIKILQATVGGITEADVHLADASDAIIIGFRVVPDEGARSLAEKRGVQVRRYEVIYKVTEELKDALEGMLKPEEQERELGRALVLRLFTISRVGTISGCRVLSGTIERNARVRLIRENRIIGDYALDSLKREKDDAREVREGFECGIKLQGFNDIKEGDVLEAYKIEEIARKF